MTSSKRISDRRDKSNIAYRYRLYPDHDQQVLFARTFGCCRKVYNLMLGDKKDFYRSDGLMLYVTPAMYKDKYPYLKEVDSLALANEQLHVESAYKNYMEQPSVGEPRFKDKHRDRDSYTTNLVGGNIAVYDASIKLPKLGRVKAKVHRYAPSEYKLKSVTVSRERDGSYYASVLYEYEETATPVAASDLLTHVGLDYKSDGLFVDSYGNTCGMPHFYREAQARLRKAQRKLSHMIESHVTGYKVSGNKRYPIYDRPLSECKNIQKQRAKVARLHRHVANSRNDFHHKVSAEITNQYDLVSVEGLNMKAMSNKGFGNGKATLDNGYGSFVSMLEYKQKRKGHHLIKVDKWFPSSQLCHVCGYQNPEIKDMRIREWDCPVCKHHHDRDLNAAINIDSEGLRILLA